VRCYDELGFSQGRQGAANTGGSHAHAGTELGDGRGALDLQGPRDALCSLTGEFHNTIVALFRQCPQLEIATGA
jgi:hypothetical protein